MHTYYDSLSAAITAVNGGAAETVTAENAKAAVITSAGQLTKVKLLGDATESASVTVQNNIDLVLNGYTLRFTAPAACLQFGANTRCFIHGAGGSIVKELDTAVATPVMLVSSDGSSLQLRGGSYMVSANSTGAVLAVRAAAAYDLFEMEGCTVEARNATGMAVGVQTQAGNSFLTRTHCTAKATGLARGLMSTSKVKLTDCHMEGSSINSESNAVRIMSGAVTAEGCSFTSESQLFVARTIYSAGSVVAFTECNICADAYHSAAHGVEQNAGTLELAQSCVIATAHKGENADGRGITVGDKATLKVSNCVIIADCTPNCVKPGDNTVGISKAKYMAGKVSIRIISLGGRHKIYLLFQVELCDKVIDALCKICIYVVFYNLVHSLFFSDLINNWLLFNSEIL